MDRDFEIVSGSEDIKHILFDTLHEKGDFKTWLKEFLEDLETSEGDSKWWVAVDEYEKPRGALTVRYIDNTTYLRSLWTRVIKTTDQDRASRALINTWLENPNPRAKYFQADLPVFSYLIPSIEASGFQKSKMLLCIYEVENDWMVADLPSGYIMRPILRSELPKLYKSLIEPDLDPSSPIYTTETDFNKFVNNLPDETLDSWVCVENEVSKIVGFGASFLNYSSNQKSQSVQQAVLFGPHSTESQVLIGIISEMMSYWKARGVSTLRIMRVSEFYPSVVNKLNLGLTHSTVRYVYSRE